MLKKRLIPTIIVRQGIVVQSIGFKRFLPIGKPKITIEFFNRWDCDEIALIQIDRGGNIDKLCELTDHVGKVAYVPLLVGGGVRSIEGFRRLLNSGADKVSINTAAYETPQLITQAADLFGDQEVVVSIDAKLNDSGVYEVYIDGGRKATGVDVREWAREVQGRGAGEILLNSIDNDGSKKGYDTTLIKQVSDEVTIPVIALGGVGKIEHFPAAIIDGGADAAAAANIFHHIEQSIIQAKESMRRAGINVRKCDSMYSDKVLHSADKAK